MRRFLVDYWYILGTLNQHKFYCMSTAHTYDNILLILSYLKFPWLWKQCRQLRSAIDAPRWLHVSTRSFTPQESCRQLCEHWKFASTLFTPFWIPPSSPNVSPGRIFQSSYLASATSPMPNRFIARCWFHFAAGNSQFLNFFRWLSKT